MASKYQSYDDIDVSVLMAVEALLKDELQTKISDVTDVCRLKYIEVGDLQIDFTRQQTNVAIALGFPNSHFTAGGEWVRLDDPLLAESQAPNMPIEIGGPLWLNVKVGLRSELYFNAIPDAQTHAMRKATRRDGFILMSTWLHRLEAALASDPTLDGLTNIAGDERMVGGNHAVIEARRKTLTGEDGSVIVGVDMLLSYPVIKGA